MATLIKKKWLVSFNPDTTAIMIYSNRSIPENLYFSFNEKSVPITTSYKHLGATFSNDAKWNTHMLIIFRVAMVIKDIQHPNDKKSDLLSNIQKPLGIHRIRTILFSLLVNYLKNLRDFGLMEFLLRPLFY
jgi:hypothetical protein